MGWSKCAGCFDSKLQQCQRLRQSLNPTMRVHEVILESGTYGNFISFNWFPSSLLIEGTTQKGFLQLVQGATLS